MWTERASARAGCSRLPAGANHERNGTAELGNRDARGPLPRIGPALAVSDSGFLTPNVVYIPLREEPQLAERFGDPYPEYRHVLRFLPSLRPCDPDVP